MRRLVVAGSLFVAVFLLVPTAIGAPSHASDGLRRGSSEPRIGPTHSSVGVAGPTLSGAQLRTSWFRNSSLHPSANAPLATGPAVSSYPEGPPPALPGTTPVVQTFLSYTLGCCVEENFSVPNGTWETVVLNYTGVAVGSDFDSSYRAYLDGNLVLMGTTPEYGTWTVLQNLTEYSSLLHGVANLTFLLGLSVGSMFRTNLTISYYPVPTGGTPPAAPSEIVPLWKYQSVLTPGAKVYVNATVPSNTTAAVLRLYAYPYATATGTEEFFWAGLSGGDPAGFRLVEFGLNSTPMGGFSPFPVIQTGGIDLFLWRPISGAFTSDLPAYDLNLSGGLGDIEGSHEYWAAVPQISPGGKWLLEASLLLWTDPTVTGASPVASSFTGPTITSAVGLQRATVGFSASSQVNSTHGNWVVSSDTTIGFSDAITTSSSGNWTNFTEQTSFLETTHTTSPTGNSTEVRQYGFPISTAIGGSFRRTSTTGGGYPILGDFTTSMVNTNQEWNAAVTDLTTTVRGPAVTGQQLVDDQLVGASGTYGGEESVASVTSQPQILQYNFSTASTEKQYSQAWGPPTDAARFTRLLSAYAPALRPPDESETVLEDRVATTPFPLETTITSSAPSLDVGRPLVVAAEVTGGTAPYGYLWTGLPAGCAAANTSLISCTVPTAGLLDIGVQARDSLGWLSAPVSRTVLVVPALVVDVTAVNSAVDQGGNASFLVSVAGGVPPLNCAWTVGTGSVPGPCSGTFVVAVNATGDLFVHVSVADATGTIVASPIVDVTVSPPVSVALFDSSSTVHAGAPVTLSAVAAGGVEPESFAWSLNGTPWPGVGGSNVTFVPAGAGTYTFAVVVTDAAGSTSQSNGVVVTVSPAPVSGTGTSSAGPGGIPLWIGYLLVAGIVGELALIVYRQLRPPSPPTTRARPN